LSQFSKWVVLLVEFPPLSVHGGLGGYYHSLCHTWDLRENNGQNLHPDFHTPMMRLRRKISIFLCQSSFQDNRANSETNGESAGGTRISNHATRDMS
jgi:hypothetical protein